MPPEDFIAGDQMVIARAASSGFEADRAISLGV
jgi:hypothetical protein